MSRRTQRPTAGKNPAYDEFDDSDDEDDEEDSDDEEEDSEFEDPDEMEVPGGGRSLTSSTTTGPGVAGNSSAASAAAAGRGPKMKAAAAAAGLRPVSILPAGGSSRNGIGGANLVTKDDDPGFEILKVIPGNNQSVGGFGRPKLPLGAMSRPGAPGDPLAGLAAMTGNPSMYGGAAAAAAFNPLLSSQLLAAQDPYYQANLLQKSMSNGSLPPGLLGQLGGASAASAASLLANPYGLSPYASGAASLSPAAAQLAKQYPQSTSSRQIKALWGDMPTQQMTKQMTTEQMTEQDDDAAEDEEDMGVIETYENYKPAKVKVGKPHPDPVVETASLASVDLPDVWHKLLLPDPIIDEVKLSALQLEAVIYSAQQHGQFLEDDNRAGFLVGDGAGVGKGRTIAGIIYENWLQGRKRALWISVSNDLKYDAERDLADIGAASVPVHFLSKMKYGKINSSLNGNVSKGVIYVTYSALIGESSTGGTKYRTRLKMLQHWCGDDFDGCIIFDECHKAKNLCPSAAGKPTKTGLTVLELQKSLPKARIVYSSATGASEPKHMAYMVRLGIWGPGSPFPNFSAFLNAVEKRGVGAMEIVAMDMKLRGMYIARQLSFQGVTFRVDEIELAPEIKLAYDKSVKFWVKLMYKFQEAAELIDAEKKMKKTMWGQFWSSHQRFFKYMCIAAKVPHVIKVADEVIKMGKCVVIGLQSTGEARTIEAVEKEEELTDFVSTAKGTLTSLVEKHFPAPDRNRIHKILGIGKPKSLLDELGIGQSNGAAAGNGAAAAAAGDAPLRPGEKRKSSRRAATVANSRLAAQKDDNKVHKIKDDSGDEFDSSDSEKRKASRLAAQRASKKVRSSAAAAAATKKSGDEFDDSDSEYAVSDEAEAEEEDDDDDEDDEEEEEEADASSDYNPFGGDSDSDSDDPWTKKRKKETKQKGKKKKEKKPPVDPFAHLFKGKETENGSHAPPPPRDNVEKACHMKEELLREIEVLGEQLPANTLDQLIDELGGPENVAEMTGRKGRVVQCGRTGDVRYESRSEQDVTLENLNLAEKERFMSGEKDVAIISEAASSGISLQADRRVKNQKRRVHMTLELPWSADRAIQQFGRTHRSNQVSGPEYILLISDLAGEQRFASIVAKRLESLGALTHGDRRAGEARDLSRFNIDNKYGRAALENTFKAIMGYDRPMVKPPADYKGDFFKDIADGLVGVGLITQSEDSPGVLELEKGYSDMSKFLNRILGLPVEKQNALFKYFSDTLAAIISQAKRTGRYDQGILDVGLTMEDRVELVKTHTFLRRHSTGKAKIEVDTLQVERGLSWRLALEKWAELDGATEGFYLSHQVRNGKKTAVLAIVSDDRGKKKKSKDEKLYTVYRPNTGQQVKLEPYSELKKKYKMVKSDEAESHWNEQFEASKTTCSHAYWRGKCKNMTLGLGCEIGLRSKTYNVLAGSVLSVWNKVEAILTTDGNRRGTGGKMQVVRIKLSSTDAVSPGRRIVGTLIPNSAMKNLLAALNDDSDEQEETIHD